MSATGIFPLVGVGVIIVLFVAMVIGKRRAQRMRRER
jgi:Mg2+/citrate symporter